MGLTSGHMATIDQIMNGLKTKLKDYDKEDGETMLEDLVAKIALPDSAALNKELEQDEAELAAMQEKVICNKFASNIFKDCEGMSADDAKAYKAAIVARITELEKAAK